jgi:hypothetical protein
MMLLEKALSDINKLPHINLGDSTSPGLCHSNQRDPAASL